MMVKHNSNLGLNGEPKGLHVDKYYIINGVTFVVTLNPLNHEPDLVMHKGDSLIRMMESYKYKYTTD